MALIRLKRGPGNIHGLVVDALLLKNQLSLPFRQDSNNLSTKTCGRWGLVIIQVKYASALLEQLSSWRYAT